MIKFLMSRFTMNRIEYCFTDVVSGKPVFKCVDCYGQYWLTDTNNPFGFRIKCQEQGYE